MWVFTICCSDHRDQKADREELTAAFVQQFLELDELNKVSTANDTV